MAGVAADVWGAIGEEVRVDALLDAVGLRYPEAAAPAGGDVRQFLEHLGERDLVVTVDGAFATAPSTSRPASAAWLVRRRGRSR